MEKTNHRWRSDSPSKVYTSARSRTNEALIRKLITPSLLLRLPESFCSLPSEMQYGPEPDPDAEGDPFRRRKVPRQCRHNFLPENQQRNANPPPPHDPHQYPPPLPPD